MSGGCFDGGSSSGSKKRKLVHQRSQVNDSLFELHKPEGTPSVEIVLFHGLNLGKSSDAHLSTWEAEDGSIWPQTWLVDEYPAAHIFTVSYSGGVGKTSYEKFDMDIIVENLISDLRDADIGQTPYCPVVLVGHSFGGLVIKQLCLESRKRLLDSREDERAKSQSFLDNVRGIFYYGTPHHGSPLVSPQAAERNRPLLMYFRILNTEAERLNLEFDGLCRSYPKWRVGGLGESLPPKSGLFQDVAAVSKASLRRGDFYIIVAADDISISKPSSKKDRRFYSFTDLLNTIARNLEEEGRKHEGAMLQEAHRQNFQCLPEPMVHFDAEVGQIMSKPKTVILGFGHLANLNHLEFHDCWDLQTLPDSFGHLATLNHLEFHHCSCLKTLPDSFGHLVTLNHLEFHDCWQLETLPDSFGHLATLNHLEFHGCHGLRTLPDSFGHLATLNHLEFHNCKRLQTLPDSFGHLATLNHLEFHGCWLETLPDSFGHLATLNHLEFHHCSCLKTLPVSFGHLATLNHLEFHHCSCLKTLPDSFGHLATLNHLEFHHCSCLKTLPDSFGHLATLNHLEFHGFFELRTLPDSFGHLANLNHLEFHRCWLETLPDSFGHLATLNHLEFHHCSCLKTLPDSFGHLATLNHLEFHHCSCLKTLPDSFGHLATLNHLEFHGCRELRTLPDSFGHLATLNHLEFDLCPRLQTLPDSFGHLATLNHLEFHGCRELRTLPDSFGHLATLNHLEFDLCPRLQTLPDSFGHLVTTLSHLKSHNCNQLQTLLDSFGHLATVNHVLKWDCGDTECESDWEQKFRRFITEVIDEGANGYFVSKIWLSSLDKHQREEVMSVIGGAGYCEIYQTRTTMFYERIEDEMQGSTICNDSETYDTKATYLERIQSHSPNSQTNQGETFSLSNKGNAVGEAGSSTASQGSGDSLRDDLQSMDIADKVSGVKNATEASPKIHAKCECPLQRLTVSMRREAGPSTSSSQVEGRIPVGEQFKIFTGVDKNISMKTFDFTQTGSLEVDVPLTVSTEIGLSCCVTSDHENVRIHLLEIRGEVTVGNDFDRRTNALALKSVRTNVNASINPGPENVRLNIKGNNSPHRWRRVLDTYQPLDNNGQRMGPEDLMWLDLTAKRLKNSIVGSKTLELQHHVKKRLKIDLDEDSHRALLLYFDGSLPVTFEGDILGDLDPNSFLELHVRHDVEISYNVPCDPRPTADAISAFTTRINKVVEFDCVLEFRT